jgi:hypothetical protein
MNVHIVQTRDEEAPGSVDDNGARRHATGAGWPDRLDHRSADDDALRSNDSVAVHRDDRDVAKHDTHCLRARCARQDRARAQHEDSGRQNSADLHRQDGIRETDQPGNLHLPAESRPLELNARSRSSPKPSMIADGAAQTNEPAGKPAAAPTDCELRDSAPPGTPVMSKNVLENPNPRCEPRFV